MFLKVEMGNQINRLTVFENIVDVYHKYDDIVNDEDGYKYIKTAVETKNMPFLFLSIALLGINPDTNYGNVKLSYNELLKQHKHLYSKEDMTLITSQANVIQTDIIPLLKENYQKICHDLYKTGMDCHDFCRAIMDGDVDTLVVYTKCMGFAIGNNSGMEQHFNIKELLSLYEDDEHWIEMARLMNKNYNYSKFFVNIYLMC